jgi:hypothetical protein
MDAQKFKIKLNIYANLSKKCARVKVFRDTKRGYGFFINLNREILLKWGERNKISCLIAKLMSLESKKKES